MKRLALRVHGQQLAVVRLSAGATVTRTDAELSIVCDWDAVPGDVPKVGPWRAFVVAGPLDFGLVGVMATLAGVLAEAGVPLLAISTHDTDWIFVREERVADAWRAFEKAGISVAGDHTSSGWT